MTTQSTTTSPAPTRATGSPQWLRVARLMLGSQVVFGLWSILTLAVLTTVILALVSRGVEPSMSGFQFAIQVAMWLPFGVNIVLVVSFLRVFIAAGSTRRSFIRAGVLTSVVTAVGYAVAMTALLAVERAVYERRGWIHGFGDGTPNLVLSEGVAQQFWGTAVIYTVMALSGLLVGATFLRLQAWATLLLPLTVALPLVAASLATPAPRTVSVFGDSPHTLLLGGLDPALSTALQLVVIAMMTIAVWLTVRDLSVRQPTG